MTVYAFPPSYFGAANGRYRAALATASSGAANAANSAYLGAANALQETRAPAIEDSGIRAGELIGYRAWLLMDDGFLHGMFMTGYTWLPKAIEICANVNSFWGPGLHAFKDLAEARSQYFYYGEWPVVYGEVALWGEVIEHEKGYRAEYAAIRRLLAFDSSFIRMPLITKLLERRRLTVLRERYGVAA